MTQGINYKDKLNNMDFEQLIMEREDLAGELYDFECDIREGFIEDGFSSVTNDPEHYQQTLKKLALLSEQMSLRIPEFMTEWKNSELPFATSKA